MEIVARIINNEYFGGLFEISQVKPEWQITKVLPDENLILKKWNGTGWYEGTPVSELNAQKKQETLNYLSDMISKINRYITAMAMGKSVHDDLDYYELAYTTKYNLCKAFKVNPNADPYNTLATEAQLEGVAKVNDYVYFVIAKFEQGKTFRDRGVQLIECLRKRIYADLASNNFDVANQRLKIIDDLPADVKAEQVGAIYNQVMNL